uniref:MD-2-related lipid-recognition domain-containing protein n=1 Tax=Timema shepardi TaxID=629360 RepID=A0A7R9B2V7_TIMSH|nr:unnamed protein product [Timema shepardi]
MPNLPSNVNDLVKDTLSYVWVSNPSSFRALTVASYYYELQMEVGREDIKMNVFMSIVSYCLPGQPTYSNKVGLRGCEGTYSQETVALHVISHGHAGIHFLFNHLSRRTTRTVDMLRIILVTVLLASSAIATTFDSCTDGGAAPTSVAVTGCAEQPCDFAPGTKIVVDIGFTADKDVTALAAHVFATVQGLTIEYTLDNSNACELLKDSTCPLDDGEAATYHLEVEIPDITLKSEVLLKFYLEDQSSERVTCFQLDGQVV